MPAIVLCGPKDWNLPPGLETCKAMAMLVVNYENLAAAACN